MRKIWLLALAAALLTTACRIETNILIALNADETGSFGIEIGTDEEFRQVMAQEGDFSFDTDDILGGLNSEAPGATVTSRTEGDMEFTVVTFEFASKEALQQLIDEGGVEGGDFDVQWTDGAVTITATVEGSGDAGGLGLGDLGNAAGEAGGDFDFDLGSGLEGFAGNIFSGSVIVAMPGEVSSHNADRVLPDGRLQWDLALDGSDIDVMAVSGLGGSDGLPSALIVLLALAAAGVLLWLITAQRKRSAVAAVEAAGAGAAATQAPPRDWSTPTSDEPSPPQPAVPDPPAGDAT